MSGIGEMVRSAGRAAIERAQRRDRYFFTTDSPEAHVELAGLALVGERPGLVASLPRGHGLTTLLAACLLPEAHRLGRRVLYVAADEATAHAVTLVIHDAMPVRARWSCVGLTKPGVALAGAGERPFDLIVVDSPAPGFATPSRGLERALRIAKLLRNRLAVDGRFLIAGPVGPRHGVMRLLLCGWPLPRPCAIRRYDAYVGPLDRADPAPLWPQRFPVEHLRALRRAIGARAFADEFLGNFDHPDWATT